MLSQGVVGRERYCLYSSVVSGTSKPIPATRDPSECRITRHLSRAPDHSIAIDKFCWRREGIHPDYVTSDSVLKCPDVDDMCPSDCHGVSTGENDYLC